MSIVAAITNISALTIPFPTTTGGTAIEPGATATLTLADSFGPQLVGLRTAGKITFTVSQLSDRMANPLIIPGRKQITGTTYTILPSDAGLTLECTNAGGCVITLPATLPAGLMVEVLRYSGAVTWSAGSGAVVRVPGAQTGLAAQYAMARFHVRDNIGGSAAEWIVSGNIS